MFEGHDMCLADLGAMFGGEGGEGGTAQLLCSCWRLGSDLS